MVSTSECLSSIKDVYPLLQGFPNGPMVKNPPAKQEKQETWVQSLGREDPLEKEITVHFSIHA